MRHCFYAMAEGLIKLLEVERLIKMKCLNIQFVDREGIIHWSSSWSLMIRYLPTLLFLLVCVET